MSAILYKLLLRTFFLLLITGSAMLLTAQDSTYVQEYHSSVREVPDSVTEKMKKEKDFLYANDPAFWQKEKPPEPTPFQKFIERIIKSPVLKWVFYFLIAALILFTLYQVMIVNNFFVFSRKARQKKAEETDADELIPDDLDGKIRKAISGAEYRLAIRYMYLKTLQVLSDRQLIRLHAQSTNHDYIVQMRTHKDGQQFTNLAHIYEFVWYGKFQPTENQFGIIETNFNQFISSR